MSIVVEKIAEIPSMIVGEGPHWDAKSQALYFVDIMGKSVHKYVPATGKHTKATFDKAASLIIPVKGQQDKFVVNQFDEIVLVSWDGVSEKPSKIERLVEMNRPNSSLNDGKCDVTGRLWTGTMAELPENPTDFEAYPRSGALFSFHNGKLRQHVDTIALSNGLAWNDNLNKFYYIDSATKKIDAFDFDVKTGTISNQEAIFSFSKHGIEGIPDGMTVDVEGNLWVAVFGGSRVIKINPRKPETLLDTIQLPAQQITSVGWGGAELDVLYVTSASIPFGNYLADFSPENGATFRIRGLGTRGLPPNEFAL